MKAKSARKTAPRNRANAEAKRPGRANGATELATLELKDTVAGLYSQGVSVHDICKRVNRGKSQVYAALSDVRLEIIGKKKAHFDNRLALYLDDAFDNTATHHQLLQDEDFLRSAAPERLKAIGSNLGIISDKIFVLLAASARGARFAQPGQPEGTEGVPG